MKRTLRSLLVLLLVCISGVAFGQSSGIGGTLKDGKGEPIISASVTASEGGIQKGGTTTDYDGRYVIKPLSAGRYDVTFSYQGRKVVVNGVIVGASDLTTVNEKIDNGPVKMGEVTIRVTRFDKPLTNADNPSKKIITSQELEHLGTRTAVDAVALGTNVYQSKTGGALNLGGSRSSGALYVIDGVQIPAGSIFFANQPYGSVDQIQTYTSGVPARYGDASGGVIAITSKGITAKTRAGVNFEHSVEGYNHNQGSFNLSGPLLRHYKDSTHKEKVPLIGYTLSAEGIYDADQNPSYGGNMIVKDEVKARIDAHPLVSVINPSGEPTLGYASEYLNNSDFENQKRHPNTPYKRGTVVGKLDYQLSDNVNIVLGGNFNASVGQNYDRNLSLLSYDNYSQTTTYSGTGYIRFTQKFGRGNQQPAEAKGNGGITNAFYTVQADYKKDYRTTQDPNHLHNTFDYGYVGKFFEDYAPIYAPGRDPATDKFGVLLQGYTPTGVRFERSEINPVLANYTSDYYNSGAFPLTQSAIFNGQGLRNGDAPRDAYALWRNTGYAQRSWSKLNEDQVAVTVDASFDLKRANTTHAIEFGLYYQQRNERSYGVGGASIWTIMRQLTGRVVNQQLDSIPIILVGGQRYTYQDYLDGKVNPGPNDTFFYERKFNAGAQGAFDKNLRAKLGAGNHDYINVDALDPSFFSLDMFSADELFNSGSSLVSYSGYDYAGNIQKGQVNFNDFWTKKDDKGNYTRPIGAYRPNYIAGYLSDNIRFRQDVRFNLGVRVERFDANTKVLKDPYSLYATKTAGQVPGSLNGYNGGAHPSNIGSDYVVYVADNNSSIKEIIGYRSGDDFFDAFGRPVEDPKALANLAGGGNPQPYLQSSTEKITDANFRPENSFTDYKPQVNVMPRINFSFPINEDAFFYAHYDVMVQRPTSGNFATPVDYYYLTANSNSIIGNPDLKPEKTVDYEVGFQQKLSNHSAVTLTAFYKERKDQIQVRPYLYAYPTTYYTYGNRDFSTSKGFSIAYDLRRVGPVTMTLNYTLSFAEGTGSDATSANGGSGQFVSSSGLLQNFITASLPNLRSPFALNYDSRHIISANIDYRYNQGEGPVMAGRHFLENAGANLTILTRSGEPYTRYAQAQALLTGVNNSSLIEGNVNGSRLPWHFVMNLRVDKDFAINFKKQSNLQDIKRNGGLSGTIFVSVLNLLNSKDILRVYGYSGRADDDGYLTSPQGAVSITNQVNATSFVDQYNIKANDPSFLNNPRRISLGFQFNF